MSPLHFRLRAYKGGRPLITCIEKRNYTVKNGKPVVMCWLMADEKPDSFPENGSDVELMLPEEQFAKGSFIQICGSTSDNGKVFFYNGEGWYQWN